MFETFNYLTLQQYWWILVAILASWLVFTMFTMGWQSIFMRLGKDEEEKDLILNAFWKHYKLTFTLLVIFGWAIFASFPVFYATSFGWAYFVWMAILFVFIIQYVSYEYRSKAKNFLWKSTYDRFLWINGFFAPFLLWIALATFFTGANFTNDAGIVASHKFQRFTNTSTWVKPSGIIAV